MLLERIPGEGRADDILHPSELAKNGWCHRASYYKLIGTPRKASPKFTVWQLEMIYDEGKEIHKKWQSRFWDLGCLYGAYYCLYCQHSWSDTSPEKCPECNANRSFLIYHEVPLLNMNKRIGGHADGQQGSETGPIIEIKSIGVNSLRFENPELLDEHTYKFSLNGAKREFVDLQALWDGIQVPMPSAIRQGHIYNWLSGTTETIYIYECKWNQRSREFVIKYRQERIQPILDKIDEVNRSLATHEPPKCSFGGCAECEAYEEGADGSATSQPKNRRRVSSGVGEASRTRTFRRVRAGGTGT